MKNHTIVTIAATAGVLSALALAGCSPSTPTTTDNAATIKKYCSTCHTSDFSSVAADNTDWNGVVDLMVNQYGAKFTDSQKSEVVTALEATY